MKRDPRHSLVVRLARGGRRRGHEARSYPRLGVPAEPHTDLPYPGDELVYRVTGTAEALPSDRRRWFFESGRQSADAIAAALAVVSRKPGSFERVLDFGCGPGRVLLWLRDLAEAGAALHGTDIDARAIAWAREHIPWAEFTVNQPLPPLSYRDGSFDLIINHSVFTHLDAAYQDQWLGELHRVTAPGALLLLSVNGAHAFGELERHVREHGGDASDVRAILDREGIVFVRDDSWFGSAFPDFYHSTFHLSDYVLAHWGWYFEVRAYLPRHALGHQDVVLLERRAGDLPPGGPVDRLAAAAMTVPPLRPGEPLLEHVERRLAPQPGLLAEHEAHFDPLGARRAAVRVIERFHAHHVQVAGALRDCVAELFAIAARIDKDVTGVRDGVLRQSERISRLELELLARIEQLDARQRALDGDGGAER
jgi:SAM-dependent methyltransferase